MAHHPGCLQNLGGKEGPNHPERPVSKSIETTAGVQLDILELNIKSNQQAGFKKTGIYPFDLEHVFSRLPRQAEDDDESVNSSVSDVFVTHLQEMRYGT